MGGEQLGARLLALGVPAQRGAVGALRLLGVGRDLHELGDRRAHPVRADRAGAGLALALDLHGPGDPLGALEGADHRPHAGGVGEPFELARHHQAVAVEVVGGGALGPGQAAPVAAHLVVGEQRGLVDAGLRRDVLDGGGRDAAGGRLPLQGARLGPTGGHDRAGDQQRGDDQAGAGHRVRTTPRGALAAHDGRPGPALALERAAQLLEQQAHLGAGRLAGHREARGAALQGALGLAAGDAERPGDLVEGQRRHGGEDQRLALERAQPGQRVQGGADPVVEALLPVPGAGGVPALRAAVREGADPALLVLQAADRAPVLPGDGERVAHGRARRRHVPGQRVGLAAGDGRASRRRRRRTRQGSSWPFHGTGGEGTRAHPAWPPRSVVRRSGDDGRAMTSLLRLALGPGHRPTAATRRRRRPAAGPRRLPRRAWRPRWRRCSCWPAVGVDRLVHRRRRGPRHPPRRACASARWRG